MYRLSKYANDVNEFVAPIRHFTHLAPQNEQETQRIVETDKGFKNVNKI